MGVDRRGLDGVHHVLGRDFGRRNDPGRVNHGGD
jgi:hypothetical protein